MKKEMKIKHYNCMYRNFIVYEWKNIKHFRKAQRNSTVGAKTGRINFYEKKRYGKKTVGMIWKS